MGATSFKGMTIYKVTEVAEVEYIKVNKKWFSKKVKVKRTKLEDVERSVIIVANNPQSAVEKRKDRYVCWKMGDNVTGWIELDKYKNSTVMSTSYKAEVANLTAKELFGMALAEDYVKYMKFLDKGFDEILSIEFMED